MSKSRKADAFSNRWRWLIWLLGALLALALNTTGLLQNLDSRLHDIVLRALPSTPPAPGITLIDIDEASLATLGSWPWPRPLLAQVMHKLREQGAALQVWDITFTDTDTTDTTVQAQLALGDIVIGQIPVLDPLVNQPPQDGRLQAASADQAPPVCSQHAPLRGWLGVSPQLAPPFVGHLAATPNADGQLRSLPAVICDNQARYPLLALAAAQAANPQAPWQLSQNWQPWRSSSTLQRGNWQFALDSQGNIPLPYARPHTTWPAISVQQLFNASGQQPAIKGHTVVVGATALGLSDNASTPYHPNAPGVSIHADILSAAIAGQPWPAMPAGSQLISALLVIVYGAWLLKVNSHTSPRRIAAATVVAGIMPAFTMLLLWPTGVRLAVWSSTLTLAGQGIAALAWQAWCLRAESQRLAQHLQSFMPKELAQQIVRHNPSDESLGQAGCGVVLALRVDGLKRWVASVEALHALGFTHALHASAQTQAASHGGRVEHVMGDTLLLAWAGQDGNTLQNVIKSVDQIVSSLTPVLLRNETHTHPLSLQMAIDCGDYLIGLVGSASSRRSVMLGAAPTRTLAILDLCVELASPIVLTETTAQVLQPNPRLHTLGQFLLPEQARAVGLYRLADANRSE